MRQNQGKSVLLRVSGEFELPRVLVIGVQLYCSKSIVSHYFVTVFFSNKMLLTHKNLSLFEHGKMSTIITIVTMKIDSVQIISVRKAGLTISESSDSGHRKVSVVRINRCPYKAG